jgi:hypothetical protein
MIVRSRLPWPLRWAVAALALGFSAAIALWAFELGKEIAGVDQGAKEELSRLRAEIKQLRQDQDQARQISNTAESLLRTERAAQERLALQLRQLETEKQALQADLGFFERLLPSTGEGLQVRGLQAETPVPGQLRYQMLLVQNGKNNADFTGRYDLQLSGLLDGKPWVQAFPGGGKALQLRQVLRLAGTVEHPATAVIKTVQAKVVDAAGAIRATQTVKF